MANVYDTSIGLQSAPTTAYCMWKCRLSNVDHFRVRWVYYLGVDSSTYGGFEGAVNEVSAEFASSGYYKDTYTAPSGSWGVHSWVQPVSKTRTVNGVETSYWTEGWTITDSWGYRFEEDNPPEKPDTPTVELDTTPNSDNKFKVICSTGIITDRNTEYMHFNIIKISDTGGSSLIQELYCARSGWLYCSVYAYLSPGIRFRVACRGINNLAVIGTTKVTLPLIDGTTATLYSPLYGEWSEYTSIYSTPPDKPTNPACSAYDETTVKVTWTKGSGATGYEVQYSKDKDQLETAGDVSTFTVESDTNTAYVTGLDSGEEWFFRIRSTNDAGYSLWTSIVSTVIGTTPEAPTTWASSTVATIGDIVNLYWVHNCEDGSDQSAAEIQLNTSSIMYEIVEVEGDERSYELNTESYDDGTELTWKVRTAGITGEFGEWSTTRTIKINAPAYLTLDMPETLTSFPYTIIAETGPSSQRAISYHISVYSLQYYETIGPTGETISVNADEEIYSKLYNTNLHTTPQVLITLSVGDLTLASGVTYKVVVTAVMDTGVTVENSSTFIVEWDDALYSPEAGVGINFKTLCAYISPYCERIVEGQEDVDPNEAERELVPDCTLSVYRREFDGSFTLIGDGVTNDGTATMVDPHPALDYARYRIVAQDNDTGQISYSDIPGVAVNQSCMIIQWDEDWQDFDVTDTSNADVLAIPTWNGSMIKIPYNLDVSESNDKDVSLIEYIGRSEPVSYYGTQIAESGAWNIDIPKDDVDTLYALRRLSKYMSDVYVREPTGIGYWASISVSMNINHKETVIPVSISINRVEGGV